MIVAGSVPDGSSNVPSRISTPAFVSALLHTQKFKQRPIAEWGTLGPAEAGTDFSVDRRFHQLLSCALHSLALGVDRLHHRRCWRALLSHAFLYCVPSLALTFRPQYCFDVTRFPDVVVLDGRLQLCRQELST